MVRCECTHKCWNLGNPECPRTAAERERDEARAEVARLRGAMREVYGHTACAVTQSIDCDDQIIIGHCRDAAAIARAALAGGGGAGMKSPGWTGDLTDDCVLKTQDGYIAHAEAMDSGRNEHWCCIVTIGDRPMMRTVYHSAEDGIWPIRGDLARRLCEMAIDADRWKRRGQND